VLSLEISLLGYVILRGKESGIVRTECISQLGERPDVELSFLAFGIGVERGTERALRRGHLAREPFNRLLRAFAEQRIAGTLVSERQEFEELRIIIEHLLEMRSEPALVDRVARETAAEMIVDAALADVFEGELYGVEITRLAGALAGAPKKFEQHRLREFRRPAGAAVQRIDHIRKLARRTVEFGGADDDAPLRPRALGKPRHQRAAV